MSAVSRGSFSAARSISSLPLPVSLASRILSIHHWRTKGMSSAPASPAIYKIGSNQNAGRNSFSEKPVFYAAVLDYYSLGDKSFYENHFFILQIFIEQQEYKIERSYSSFCEFDIRLRHQYPKTKIPALPLDGLAVYEKKYHKRFPLLASLRKSKAKKEVEYSSMTQHKVMTIIAKTADSNRSSVIDRKMEALHQAVNRDDHYEEDLDSKEKSKEKRDEPEGTYHSKASLPSRFRRGTNSDSPSATTSNNKPVPFYYTRRSESSLKENLLQKKLPLTVYLQELMAREELLLSELLLNFFDEEIPDSFLVAASSSSAYSPAAPLFLEAERFFLPAAGAGGAGEEGGGKLVPISSYFTLTQDIQDHLEHYLLFVDRISSALRTAPTAPAPAPAQPIGLQSRTLKKEEFTYSVAVGRGQRVFYLFFTDLYDVALSISFRPAPAQPQQPSPGKAVDGREEQPPPPPGDDEDLWRVMLTSTDFLAHSPDVSPRPANHNSQLLAAVIADPAAAQLPKPAAPLGEFTLLHYQRQPSHERVILGTIDVSAFPNVAEGVVTLRFDNSYSKWRSKTLHFFAAAVDQAALDENARKAAQILSLKADFQRRRVFLRQTLSGLSHFLTLAAQHVIDPYAQRRQAVLERRASLGRRPSETEESDGPDETGQLLQEAEVEAEAAEDFGSLKVQPPSQRLSLQQPLDTRDSLDRAEDAAEGEDEEVPSLDDLLMLQRQSEASSAAVQSSQREKMFQRLGQKETAAQLRRLTRESRELGLRLRESEGRVAELEEERRLWQEAEAERQRQRQADAEELREVREEVAQLRAHQRTLLERRQDRLLQTRVTSAEELLDLPDPPAPAEAAAEEDAAAAFELAVENFRALLVLARAQRQALRELAAGQQTAVEAARTLRAERKQLRGVAAALKERVEEVEREAQLLAHDKELLAQENGRLLQQLQAVQATQSQSAQDSQQQRAGGLPERIALPADLRNIVVTVHEVLPADQPAEEDEAVSPAPAPAPAPRPVSATQAHPEEGEEEEEEEDEEEPGLFSTLSSANDRENGQSGRLVRLDFAQSEPDELSAALTAMTSSLMDWLGGDR